MIRRYRQPTAMVRLMNTDRTLGEERGESKMVSVGVRVIRDKTSCTDANRIEYCQAPKKVCSPCNYGAVPRSGSRQAEQSHCDYCDGQGFALSAKTITLTSSLPRCGRFSRSAPARIPARRYLLFLTSSELTTDTPQSQISKPPGPFLLLGAKSRAML